MTSVSLQTQQEQGRSAYFEEQQVRRPPRSPPKGSPPLANRCVVVAQAQILLAASKVKTLSWDEYKEKHKEALADTLGDADERKMVAYRQELDKETTITHVVQCVHVVLVVLVNVRVFAFCVGEGSATSSGEEP